MLPVFLIEEEKIVQVFRKNILQSQVNGWHLLECYKNRKILNRIHDVEGNNHGPLYAL